MTLRILYSATVLLVVDIDADGAILFWRSEDAKTGEHVDLSTPHKWRAAAVMHGAIAKLHRGAA